MVSWQTVRHRVALWGRVVDADTRKPIEGATVSIEDGPDKFTGVLEAQAMRFLRSGGLPEVRDPKTGKYVWTFGAEGPCRTRSAVDGIFYFLDLPEGEYTLKASLATMGARYGLKEEKATVPRDGKGQNAPHLELPLQATTIRGRIVDAASKNGVVMAEVRMKGSGEHTFSDAQGQYLLAGIEPSKQNKGANRQPKRDDGAADLNEVPKRTVLVFAQSYPPVSEQVEISGAGAVVLLKDIKLSR